MPRPLQSNGAIMTTSVLVAPQTASSNQWWPNNRAAATMLMMKQPGGAPQRVRPYHSTVLGPEACPWTPHPLAALLAPAPDQRTYYSNQWWPNNSRAAATMPPRPLGARWSEHPHPQAQSAQPRVHTPRRRVQPRAGFRTQHPHSQARSARSAGSTRSHAQTGAQLYI